MTMRQWIRITRTRRCGRCGTWFLRGSAMVEITIHGVRTLVRCPVCADAGDVPATLAPLEERPVAAEQSPIRVSVRRGWYGEDT